MKSRIQSSKNVRKSIRRCQSGGEKTYKFSFEIDEGDSEYWDRWVSSQKRKYWNLQPYLLDGRPISTSRDDIHVIDLEITVKEPREESLFQKERKEYLYDFQIHLGKKGSNRVIESFAARFNKKNVTANELAMSFFKNIQGPDTYSDIVSNNLLFISELINTLKFTESVSSGSPDKIYLLGLYILFVELEKKLKPITDAIAERDVTYAKQKTVYAIRRIRLDSQNLEAFVSSISCIRGQSIFTDPGDLPERVVAIGDIHGDLEALFSILLKSGIIDIGGKWIAANTFLVQTGDLFDKGRLKPALQSVGVVPTRQAVVPYTVIDKNGIVQTISHGKNNFEFGEVGDELFILKFLCDLHQQATHPDKPFGNSRVLLCTGNHEFMNTSYYDYFSNTPKEEVARLVREGSNSEIQAEITKRRVKGPDGLPLKLSLSAYSGLLLQANISKNQQILNHYVGIYNTIDHQYAHPMDAVLFGGPDFPIRQEIFRHGSGYLAKKLACILNVVVVVGDFMFSHGGISSVNLQTINDVSELQRINDLFRDYLMGSPTDPDEIERYFSSQSSILWNRSLGKEYPTTKEDMQVCDNTLELVRTKLKRPNLNIVVGHDIQGTCMDPIADADRSVPRVRYVWNRTNPGDGSISTCITLPTVWCKNRIYRIDTAISRMNNAPDFRSPPEGRLNSLIIELNPDGSKKKVSAMNGILGLHPPIQR